MTPRKINAIEALLLGHSKAEAAALAGVSPATLRVWQHQSDFKEEYRRGVDSMLETTVRKAQNAAGSAVDTLESIMLDGDVQAGPRVSAARSLLEFGLRLTEQNNVLTRLAEIEAELDKMEGGQ